MFSVAFNFTKNDIEFWSIKTLSKRLLANHVDFLPIKITSIKVSRNNVDFSIREIISRKIPGKNVNFSNMEIKLKKVRGKNVDISTSEITSKKYVEARRIFWPAKLRRKGTWKWRGNSSKFGLQCIDGISTSNRRQFDVVCPLEFWLASSSSPLL